MLRRLFSAPYVRTGRNGTWGMYTSRRIISNNSTTAAKSSNKESSKKEATEDNKNDTGKSLPYFMTALRVIVVLGIISSVTNNRLLKEEADEDRIITKDIDQAIEKSINTILSDEWRSGIAVKIAEGNKDALKDGLDSLLNLPQRDGERKA